MTKFHKKTASERGYEPRSLPKIPSQYQAVPRSGYNPWLRVGLIQMSWRVPAEVNLSGVERERKRRPLAIDLAEGYDVIGFDTEWQPYPAQRVIQDVLTLHGSQFRDATVIVASPPCQAYSYRAMPWKRAKALPPPDNTLFEACFRIQREASEAAGRKIPMVVENVCGAQKWVGRAKWHYGSYYLWGDVPALMPIPSRSSKVQGQDWSKFKKTGEVSPHWNMQAIKNNGGSWFNVAHNTTSGVGNNPDGRKVNHRLLGNVPSGTGKTSWFFGNTKHELRATGGNSRKQASAMIAKIPFPLARHIAWAFRERP